MRIMKRFNRKALAVSAMLLMSSSVSFATTKDINISISDSIKTSKDGFDTPSTNPQFPEGDTGLMKFIARNLKYPIEAQNKGEQGRVVAQFVVDADGSITDISIVKSVSPTCDMEAIRVIAIMPNWNPGTVAGKPVRTRYTLPILFQLNGQAGKGVAAADKEGIIVQGSSENVEDVVEVAERAAEFPGGTSALIQYMSQNLKYPADAQKNGVSGRVLVQFIVNNDGSISDIKIVKSVSPSCDTEAVRVIARMPKWKPGIMKGEPVRTRFTMPINFSLPTKKAVGGGQ